MWSVSCVLVLSLCVIYHYLNVINLYLGQIHSVGFAVP